jgi:streptogramin lyase
MMKTLTNLMILASMACFAPATAGCGSGRHSGNGDGTTDVPPGDTLDVAEGTDVLDVEAEGPTCVDNDRDGRGTGCELGLDCDDNDPYHWNDCSDCGTTHAPGCPCSPGESFPCYEGPAGTQDIGICRAGTRSCVEGYLGICAGQVLPRSVEQCGNSEDDDCNGVGDEEVFGPCGDCDPTCHTDGDVVPDPDDPNAENVIQNPDGPGIILGSSSIEAGYAWIANSEEGTVSKLRLADGIEVGRYRVGLWGTRDDQPSRTAVDSLGNAYVASRAHVSADNNQPSVTKIAGDSSFCVDRNGNGSFETSTGPTPLDLGADECVIWTVPVGNPGGIARALAIDFGDPDNPLDPGNPWVGMWSEMRFLRLDPDSGTVTREVAVNVNPYGAAIDHSGWIWASGMRPTPGYIQRFSTVTFAVDPPVSNSGTGCDSPTEAIYSPYGIAVDLQDRVWVGSWSPNVCRYNPSDGSWFAVALHAGLARGVAADRDGTIWASNYNGTAESRLVGCNSDTGAVVTDVLISGVTPIGVGVDELGQVWTVNQTSATATRLVKSSGALSEHPVGTGPYTYSDFTGYQRSIMMDEGRWFHAYQRCNESLDDRWGDLTWDVSTPSDSTVTIYGYSAGTEAALLSATPVILARIAPDAPPVDVASKFADAGVALYEWLGVLVVLSPSSDMQSPVVRAVEVQWHCFGLG